MLGRAYRVECDLLLEDDPAALRETDALLFRAERKLLACGAVFERPYGRLPELVYTEPVATEAMRKLKRIFDPDDVLNPGRLCY